MSILEKDFIVTRVDQVYNKSLKLTQEGIGTTSISLCSEKKIQFYLFLYGKLVVK